MAACRFCRTKRDEKGAYVITDDIMINDAKLKQEAKLQQFLRLVNSMINKGWEESSASESQDKQAGKIYLHTKNPHLLGEFDKKVDDRLVNMVPNGLLFQDLFRRYVYDEKHVVFEINPLGREHSTLDFCTKVSLNKGLSDPTHAQVCHFLSRDINDSAKPLIVHNKPVTFVDGADVKMKAADQKSDVLFQESSSLQAKPSKEKYRTGHNVDRLEKQVNWWWDDKALSQFISAFSKLPSGGSIFLGVREEVDKGKQTGKFRPHSIVLNEEERTQLEIFLRKKISQNMLALPIKNVREPVAGSSTEQEHHSTAERQENVQSDLSQYVEIYFHEVLEGGASGNDCVVEVKVMHYPGLCFYKKEGPESYKFLKEGKEARVSREEWIRRMSETARFQEEEGPSTSKKFKETVK